MIGQLYRDNGSHSDLAVKKILFFIEWLRERFHLQGDVFSRKTFSLIAERSGVEEQKLFDLLELIQKVRTTETIDKQVLLELNKQIELFKKIL